MNHDYAHCLDYTPDCPKECFRAQLQRDIEEHRSEFVGVPLTYAHLGGTEECKLVKDKDVTCNMSFETDCISRRAAIDAVEKESQVDGAYGYMDTKSIVDLIMDLPSAQQWIPVSERLPKEDTDVLISYRYKDGEGDASHVYIDITSYGDMYFGGRKVKGAKHWRQPFEYFTSNYDIIAWMPLPKPWKGEEE